jgi:aldehyde dehydrogenase (NAD+)
MLVPRSSCEEVLAIATKTMEKEVVGCGFTNPEATIGPVVSKAQHDRVRSYIESGFREGARIVTGGLELPEGTESSGGYFVAPTLFADVTNDMAIASDEIFGPVLSVIPYDTEEEAIALANDTRYGLNNAVASGNLQRALNVALQLESGVVSRRKPSWRKDLFV